MSGGRAMARLHKSFPSLYDTALTVFVDPIRASIGRDNAEVVGELLDSLSIWPFTERLGWTKAQVEVLTNAARAEIEDLTLKLYIEV
jgi:hypothetical protein